MPRFTMPIPDGVRPNIGSWVTIRGVASAEFGSGWEWEVQGRVVLLLQDEADSSRCQIDVYVPDAPSSSQPTEPRMNHWEHLLTEEVTHDS
jgi:hypothetical protein